MADPGQKDDFPDLSSFDDDVSVISVSANFYRAAMGLGNDAHQQGRKTNQVINHGRLEESRHSAAK